MVPKAVLQLARPIICLIYYFGVFVRLMAAGLLASMSSGCASYAKADPIGNILLGNYVAIYNSRHLIIEKIDGPDFILYKLITPNSLSRHICTIYFGGAPDVATLYADRQRVQSVVSPGLSIEESTRFNGVAYDYEALISLPINKNGRFEHIHFHSYGVTRKELILIKEISHSINFASNR